MYKGIHNPVMRGIDQCSQATVFRISPVSRVVWLLVQRRCTRVGPPLKFRALRVPGCTRRKG